MEKTAQTATGNEDYNAIKSAQLVRQKRHGQQNQQARLMTESVSAYLLIRPLDEQLYAWSLSGSAREGAGREGIGNAEQVARQLSAEILPVLVAPAEQVALRWVAFADAERKLLAQTVPFSLEEELSGNVDHQHFALGAIENNQVAVAVVQRDTISHWLDALQAQGVEVRQMIPEQLLLPQTEKGWSLTPGFGGDELSGDRLWLVKSQHNQGFAIEQNNLKFALQLLLDESPLPPENVRIYGSPRQLTAIENQAPDLIPELLSHSLETEQKAYWQTLQQGLKQGAAMDLLQGEFARRLPWQKWWKQWRWAAMIAGLAVALQIIFGVLSLQALKQENLALRQETERVYRLAVPQGNIVRPEQQLARQVAALQGGGGEGFTSTFAKVAKVIGATQGTSIETLNYNDNQSEIGMTILAPSLNDVETLRVNMEKQGLRAELTTSSNDAGKTRARLKVSGQS